MNKPRPSRIEPAPGVADMVPYAVPAHRAPIDLHLAGNEGATPPQPVLDELRRADAEALRSYPDFGELEQRIAERHGVDPATVVVTAGADDALARALRAVAGPGREVVVPVPTFEMIGRYVTLAGAVPTEVEWPGPSYPLEGVLAAVNERTAAVVVVSPNNPTGAVADSRQIRQLLAEAPGALVIVDQAYGEYAEEDLAPAVRGSANGVLIRSLSKAWGLAGLRVGYAVGPPELIGWMRSVGQPYAVAGLSATLALQAMRGTEDWVREHVTAVRQERERLAELLVRLGARPRPTQANFVLAEFDNASWVADALAGLGIAVRRFPTEPRLRCMLRISCPGNHRDVARLEHGLSAALDPEGLLVAPAWASGVPSRGEDLDELSRRLEGRLRLARVELPSAGCEPGGAAAELVEVEASAILAARHALRGALERSGVRRAWLLARDPVAIAAARREGIVPLGWADPGSPESHVEELWRAGAARVLENPLRVEELVR